MSQPVAWYAEGFGYATCIHRCVSYESWGQWYWVCRCGAFGFEKTGEDADRAIDQHQLAERVEMPKAILDSHYIKKLFTGDTHD